MRILLDENMPLQFRHRLPGHDVATVRFKEWLGVGNGNLIPLAREEFDVLITRDETMEREVNLTEADVGIIVLVEVGTGNIANLLPMVPQILDILPSVKRGQIVQLRSSVARGSADGR